MASQSRFFQNFLRRSQVSAYVSFGTELTKKHSPKWDKHTNLKLKWMFLKTRLSQQASRSHKAYLPDRILTKQDLITWVYVYVFNVDKFESTLCTKPSEHPGYWSKFIQSIVLK